MQARCLISVNDLCHPGPLLFILYQIAFCGATKSYLVEYEHSISYGWNDYQSFQLKRGNLLSLSADAIMLKFQQLVLVNHCHCFYTKRRCSYYSNSFPWPPPCTFLHNEKYWKGYIHATLKELEVKWSVYWTRSLGSVLRIKGQVLQRVPAHLRVGLITLL